MYFQHGFVIGLCTKVAFTQHACLIPPQLTTILPLHWLPPKPSYVPLRHAYISLVQSVCKYCRSPCGFAHLHTQSCSFFLHARAYSSSTLIVTSQNPRIGLSGVREVASETVW
jgi:hypothetical protein